MESTSRRALLLRLAFELVIIFIGVYSAFALTEWQSSREAEKRRAQIHQALVREVGDITANTRRAASQAAQMLAVMDSASAAHEPFTLTPMMEPVRVEAHMWAATLESGGLELLDVATIYQLSEFYNELNAGFEQLEQLRTLSETMLVPSLGEGTEEFFDQSGRLRARYAWYPQGIRNLQRLAESITNMGDRIVADLGVDPSTSPER